MPAESPGSQGLHLSGQWREGFGLWPTGTNLSQIYQELAFLFWGPQMVERKILAFLACPAKLL